MKRTIDDVRIIRADIRSKIYTCIDAACVATDYVKSQNGGTLALGLGVFHGNSSKQKLNTKSSTEAEVVGVND